MKKIKKLLIGILVIAVSCSSLILTSCSKNAHTHSYGDWVITKQATCTEPGERQKKCSCEDIITETTPARGHNFGTGNICLDCGEKK